jgi:hypothetical protein
MFNLLVALSLAPSGYAGTLTVFTADKAVITVQGSPRDSDATNLFNAMTATPFEEASAIKKKISIKSLNGEFLFDLNCGISKNNSGYGSCILTVFKSKFATLDPSKNNVQFMVQANEAWPIVSNFVNPDSNGRLFSSIDRRLGLFVYNAGTGSMALHIFFKP